MVKIKELLTENEIDRIKHKIKLSLIPDINFDMFFKDMTVEQLSKISLIVIDYEYPKRLPNCFTSAETINILSKRAIKLNKNIF